MENAMVRCKSSGNMTEMNEEGRYFTGVKGCRLPEGLKT
jgi:hypothetical protein